MLKDLKSKIPRKKKAEEEEVESDELHDEATDPTRQSERTDVADLSDEEEEEEEENEEPVSLVDKIKAKFAKKSSSNDDKEDDEDEAPKKNAKKKIGPIHIIAILAIAYFAAEEFLMPKEEGESSPQVNSAEEAIKKKAEERKKAKEAALKAKEAEAIKTADVAPVEDAAPSTDITETPAPSIEPPTDIAVDEPVVTTPPAEPETVVTETPEAVENPDITPIETLPSETGISESKDTIDGHVTDESEDNLTDKILQDLEKQANNSGTKTTKKEYIAPPDYEFRGRGLVYNCVGKHWACVDAPSYKTCEDNASSTKTLGKSQECYPFNVYESPKGCQNVQNRMISSSAKTNFCNE